MPPQENQSSSLPPGYTLDAAASGVPKGYTMDQPSTTASTTPEPTQPAMAPGSYQTRKGGPVLDPAKTPLRTGVEALEGSFGIKDPTSLSDAFSQFGGGVKRLAGATLKDPFTPITGLASGIEGGAHDIATGVETGDWRSLASGFGGLLGTKMQMDAPEHVNRAFKTAASLIERQPTVEQGKIGYVNAARQAVDRLDNAVRTTGVGARAQSVIEADKLDLARTQSPGKVNTTDAVLAGQRMMDKTKMGAAPGGYPAQMSMDSAKALITQLGREASRMERTGKSPEAAAIWAEYDALRKATQDRASDLGGSHGTNWRDYIAEHKNYMQLQNGLLGHITEGEHTSALNKIIEHSGQLPELQKWFSKYKVDMSPISDAATEGKKLADLTQQSSNAVMGKIKLLSRHWALGLPALAGAHMGAAALGLGGGIGGFILPLIIAGKVGGLLDKMQVKQLLYDLQSKLPPEQFQVAGSPKGPMEQLHNAASAPPVQAAPTPAATPTEPTSTSSYTGLEQRVSPSGGYTGPERRTQAQQDYTAAIESTPPGKPTPGEELAEQVRRARAGAPSTITEGDVRREIMMDSEKYAKFKAADQKTQDAMLTATKHEMAGGKSELAGKLKGARSVYKGRR